MAATLDAPTFDAATFDAATFDLDTISTRPAFGGAAPTGGAVLADPALAGVGGGVVPSTPLRPVRLGVVVALVALIGVLGVLLVSGPGGAGTAPVTAAASGSHVVVGPGDTMLSILDEHHPGLDATAMRTAVASMASLNGGSRALEPGQVVALPALG